MPCLQMCCFTSSPTKLQATGLYDPAKYEPRNPKNAHAVRSWAELCRKQMDDERIKIMVLKVGVGGVFACASSPVCSPSAALLPDVTSPPHPSVSRSTC